MTINKRVFAVRTRGIWQVWVTAPGVKFSVDGPELTEVIKEVETYLETVS